MTTFIAKFASDNCSNCESRIKPGEEVNHNLDGGYTHVDCPETDLDTLANKPVCPGCWMVGPCDCD